MTGQCLGEDYSHWSDLALIARSKQVNEKTRSKKTRKKEERCGGSSHPDVLYIVMLLAELPELYVCCKAGPALYILRP